MDFLKQYLNKQWQSILAPFIASDVYKNLTKQVAQDYQNKTVYPAPDHIFRALNLVDYKQIKVVILGQDPYHGPNQANGLSFSVNPGVKLPPSLRNIYQELADDLGIERKSGDLTAWAQQGVLLLNTSLTVEAHQANSHQNYGWQALTDAVLAAVNEKESPLVFILWGKQAQKKGRFLDANKHLLLQAPHPSPLSAYRGFFGSKPFSKTNTFLESQGLEPIDWSAQ